MPPTHILSRPSDQAIGPLFGTRVLHACEVLLQLAEAVNLPRLVWAQLQGNVVFATAFLLPFFAAMCLHAHRLILRIFKGQSVYIFVPCHVTHHILDLHRRCTCPRRLYLSYQPGNCTCPVTLGREICPRTSFSTYLEHNPHLTTGPIEVREHLLTEVGPRYVGLCGKCMLDVVIDHLGLEFPDFKRSTTNFPAQRYVTLTSITNFSIGVGPP